jgi:thioredoxin reductase
MHGFLSRDGIHPAELRRLGREQLVPYGVEYRIDHVNRADRRANGFSITLRSGEVLETRKIILATGVVDRIPEVDGMRQFFGCGVHHCPYCDGWESRDRAVVAYGSGQNAAGLALSLLTWSSNVTVCTDGPSRLRRADLDTLARNGVALRTEKVTRLEGGNGHLERVIFASGDPLGCHALFFSTGQDQRCDLAGSLGCRFTKKGAVATGRLERTNVPGLWVAGDASRDVQLAIVAAAEGAKAALAVNMTLQEEARR